MLQPPGVSFPLFLLHLLMSLFCHVHVLAPLTRVALVTSRCPLFMCHLHHVSPLLCCPALVASSFVMPPHFCMVCHLCLVLCLLGSLFSDFPFLFCDCSPSPTGTHPSNAHHILMSSHIRDEQVWVCRCGGMCGSECRVQLHSYIVRISKCQYEHNVL